MSAWDDLRLRAQRSAIRCARNCKRMLEGGGKSVMAMEIEGVVIVIAAPGYSDRLARLIEKDLSLTEAMPFMVERPTQDVLDGLVPRARRTAA